MPADSIDDDLFSAQFLDRFDVGLSNELVFDRLRRGQRDQVGAARRRQRRRVDAAKIELQLARDESLRPLNARRDDNFRR